VIEQVGFEARLPTGEDILHARVKTTAGGVALDTPILSSTHDASFGPSSHFIVGSELTRLYADPGTDVACVFVRDPQDGDGNVSCYISGHLVNLP
jgi:hypothetical protein